MPKNISEIFIAPHGDTGFGRARYAPGGRFGPRRQPGWQLVVIESGSCRVRINKRRVQVREGQAILLSPGAEESFAFDPARPTVHAWATLPKPPAPRIDPGHCWRAATTSARLHQLVELGLQPGSGNPESDAERVRFLVVAAIWEFIDSAGSEAASAIPDSLVRARRHIEENLAATLTLAGVAAAAGVSRSPLRRLFLAEEGVTPMRYVRQRRLQRAAGLIAGTGMKLAAVAAACGLANEFHLSRLFKRQYGVSPREWRRR